MDSGFRRNDKKEVFLTSNEVARVRSKEDAARGMD
jgi:hypothetical protein